MTYPGLSIIKNPLYYGFLALFLLEAVEAMHATNQPNPRVISQNSASHECTDLFLWLKSVFLMA
jgi:hypothetical protein